MKRHIASTIIAVLFWSELNAQNESNAEQYRNFPLVVTLQFHSFALPFHDMRSNFSNIGLGIGTEISLNGMNSAAQQVSAVWYRNKQIGNGLLFYTQTSWRPTVASNLYTELKGGLGYLYAFRPVESHRQVNGKWISVGHKGKGLLTIPIAVSIGYNEASPKTYLSPFFTYQFLVVKDYNKSIPIVPETLLQVGSRIHFK
jgi:hypothetical protein